MKLRSVGAVFSMAVLAGVICGASHFEGNQTPIRLDAPNDRSAEDTAGAPAQTWLFHNPSDQPSNNDRFPGDVTVTFQSTSLRLESGQSTTVTATLNPPDADVTFSVLDAGVAALADVSRTEGTVQLTMRGESNGSTFLSAKAAGHIVFGALPIRVGSGAAAPAALTRASQPLKAEAAVEAPLFTVSKTLTMTLTPGAVGDYLHGDIVVFKAPVDTPAVPAIPPFLGSQVWVGGKWADGYTDWFTKSDYIAENSGMSCGPDGELTGSGTFAETLSGGGGEGHWFFAAFIYVRISDGGSWFWNSPLAVVTAQQRITVTTCGTTTIYEPGQTFTHRCEESMLIKKAPPPLTVRPTAVADANPLLVPVGGLVTLNGTGSHDNDLVGPAPEIVLYQWKLVNLTTNETLALDPVPDAVHAASLPSAGEWVASLIVTDNDSEQSDPAVDGSLAHVTIKSVGVTFAPAALSVTQGASATIQATVVPASAVGAVSFSMNPPDTIATITPIALQATPGTLIITGVAPGTTSLLAEIATAEGSATVGTANITVTEPSTEVKFKFYGRQVMFDANSNSAAGARRTVYVIEIDSPEGSYFEDNGIWSSTKAARVSIGGPIGNLESKRIGRVLEGGVEGGKASVETKVKVRSPAFEGVKELTVSNTFGTIQLSADPGNPDTRWPVPSPTSPPDETTRTYRMVSNPAFVPPSPGEFRDLGLDEVRLSWDISGDAIELLNPTPDSYSVSVRALKPSANLAVPDLARFGMLLKGRGLDGAAWNGEDTGVGGIVVGRKDIPIIVSGSSIRLEQPDPLCVGERINIFGEVRAANGTASVNNTALAETPRIDGNEILVPTKQLFLDTPGINNTGASQLKVTYISPTDPEHPSEAQVNIQVKPADRIEIQPESFCFRDLPKQLGVKIFCGNKEVTGAKIHWRILNLGGTAAQFLDADRGILDPGPFPGTVTVEASILAADSPQYVFADLRKVVDVPIHDISISINNKDGFGTVFGRAPVNLSVTVRCGPHDLANNPDAVVRWPNGGPKFPGIGEYPNIRAELSYRGRIATDSARVVVEGSIGGIPPQHVPGDFSTDASGVDVKESGRAWTSTRYYYEGYLSLPNVFVVPITRYFQGVKQNGRLRNLHVSNGVISEKARIRAYTRYAPNMVAAPPKLHPPFGKDQLPVRLVGEKADVEYNAGAGTVETKRTLVWEYELDSLDLEFPAKRGELVFTDGPEGRAAKASPPESADNRLEFLNLGGGQVYSAELSFDAMSPFVMIHGKGADERFWEGINTSGDRAWRGMTEAFDRNLIPYDNSIRLRSTDSYWKQFPSQGSIENQAQGIQRVLPAILKSLGTDHFHIMAHSKGGLDSRQWLTDEKFRDPESDKLVLGYFITMNTPHLGSVVADYVFAGTSLGDSIPTRYFEATRLASSMKYPFLLLGGVIDPDAAGSPATQALLTSSAFTFNTANVPKLNAYTNPADNNFTRPSYLCASSDADINGDGEIAIPPTWAAEILALEVGTVIGPQLIANLLLFKTDTGAPYAFKETRPAYKYDGFLIGFHVTGTLGARMAYHALRDVSAVTLRKNADGSVAAITEFNQPQGELNDFLVTKSSAEFRFPGAPFFSPPTMYFPGKMHGNVCDREVGAMMISDPSSVKGAQLK